MPRPVKCRKVCHFPNVLEFLPADDTEKKKPIVLTVDEYETIRLFGQERLQSGAVCSIYASRKNNGPANLRDRQEKDRRCTYRRASTQN